MNLSKRLYTVSNLVPKGIPAADIGADHGLLISYLAKNGIIPFGYASDNKKGPYEKLLSQLKVDNLSNKIETNLCDGLSLLDTTKYPTIIICGMGGDLIKTILKNDENKVKNAENLLLAPQGCEYELRKYLASIGFYPKKETIIFEDHFYEICLFTKEYKNMDEFDFKYGYYLRREKSIEFVNKYNTLIETNNKLISIPEINEKRKNELISINEEFKKIIK